MTTANKCAVIGAALGLLLPVVTLAAFFLLDAYGIHGCAPNKCDWIFLIWPTMIGLLLLDFPKVTALEVMLVYAVTIWLNMLIYAGVGWIAAVGYLRAFQRN